MTDPSHRKPKRLSRALLASALVLGLSGTLATAPALAAESTVTINEVKYTVDLSNPEAGATVSGYTSRWSIPSSVTIANNVSVNGAEYPVKSVGYAALSGAKITSVTIPDSITTIGDYAFESNSLKSVVLPSSITSIGEAAFKNNLGLTSINLPDGITEVKNSTFVNTRLTTIKIPDSVRVIGPAAFAASALTQITIPDGVTTIGPGAFQANAITSVSIPNSVTSLGASAFATNLLTSVEIPSGLATIPDSAFAGNKLTSLTVPSTVTTIGYGAFASNKLTSVALPEGLTTIKETAFEYNSLTSITVPSTVTTIEKRAFGSNFLKDVKMLGAAPTIYKPGGIAAFGSFGDPTGVTVSFPVQFGADVVGDGGYTTPTWQGYNTKSFSEAKLSLGAALTAGDSAALVSDITVTNDQDEVVASGSSDSADLQGITLPSGTYKLKTTGPTSHKGTYSFNEWSCSDGDTVTLSAGDDVTCTALFTFEPTPVETTPPTDPDETTGPSTTAPSSSTPSSSASNTSANNANSGKLPLTGAQPFALVVAVLLVGAGGLLVWRHKSAI